MAKFSKNKCSIVAGKINPEFTSDFWRMRMI